MIKDLMIIQFRLKLDKFYCIGVINQQNKIFLMSWQIDILKWIITGLIGKKSCKKYKKNIPKKNLLSIMHKTRKL